MGPFVGAYQAIMIPMTSVAGAPVPLASDAKSLSMRSHGPMSVSSMSMFGYLPSKAFSTLSRIPMDASPQAQIEIFSFAWADAGRTPLALA